MGVSTNITNATAITRSSIHDCIGICTYIDLSSNVTFDNNVFYYARKFLVYVLRANNYTFTNNLLAHALKRSELNEALILTKLPDDVACYEQYIPINFANEIVNVSYNLAQGSEGEGFVFPFTTCDLIDSYNFYNNTAGSCEIAFMLNVNPGQTCIASGFLLGYASEIGLMAHPPSSQQKIIYKNVFFTDNGRGITLRYAH